LLLFKFHRKTRKTQSTPIHQLRNKLTIAQLGIEVNKPEISMKALREAETILRPLDALLQRRGN
jgi:hypothetical protein